MATILIVDDIATNRDYLVTLLRYHGHIMHEAEDGSAGLASVHSHHPDLVITDVLMPVMDGYEFLRQLRLDPGTRDLPVIFYTAHYGEREARALALSSGVSAVLVKPVQSAEILKVVDRALASVQNDVAPTHSAPLTTDFDRQHVRLLTDKLSEKVGDLITANTRLKALVNIGVEIASESDSGRRLSSLCKSARELFGATYVTLGLVDRKSHTVIRSVTYGSEGPEWIEAGQSPPGILGRVVRERRTMRGTNPMGDAAVLQLPPGHPMIQ